jgi:hypothetical protein
VARPRTQIPAEIDAEIVRLYKAGASVEAIMDTLKAAGSAPVAIATLYRRVREIKIGKRKLPIVDSTTIEVAKPMPDSIADVPSDSTIEDINGWIAEAEVIKAEAKAEGNTQLVLKTLDKMAMFVKLREARVKVLGAKNEGGDPYAKAEATEADIMRRAREWQATKAA